MGAHLDVIVGDETSQANIEVYDAYLRDNIYKPKCAGSIATLIGGGREKVAVRRGGQAVGERPAGPRKTASRNPASGSVAKRRPAGALPAPGVGRRAHLGSQLLGAP